MIVYWNLINILELWTMIKNTIDNSNKFIQISILMRVLYMDQNLRTSEPRSTFSGSYKKSVAYVQMRGKNKHEKNQQTIHCGTWHYKRLKQ